MKIALRFFYAMSYYIFKIWLALPPEKTLFNITNN